MVHTLHIGEALPVYALDHPMWDLLEEGVIIAPEIRTSPGETADSDPDISWEDSAAAAAALALERAEAARVVFAAEHPGKPFYWTLHLVGLGNGNTWLLSPESEMPILTHHEDDVASGKLKRREYINQWGFVGEVIEENEFKMLEQGAPSPWDLLGRFPSSYYTSPWAATFEIQDRDGSGNIIARRTALVTGFDDVNRIFTLDDDILTSADNPAGGVTKTFTITRTTDQGKDRWQPSYFFKHGAEEMEQWIMAFCDYMHEEENWPEDLPEPVAVMVTDEDIGEPLIDWENYKDYLADVRAIDEFNEGYTIDGEHTLREWHDTFAPPQFDEEDGTYTPGGPDYSPVNAVAHSYLLATLQTAYNYHREQSTWQHFRALWPRAQLSQYQLGNGYGVTHESDPPYEVPLGPGVTSFNGVRSFKGPVSWDEYYSGPNALPYLSVVFDGQVVPSGNSAVYTTGVAGTGSNTSEFPVSSFGLPFGITTGSAWSPVPYITAGLPLFVEFTSGANDGLRLEVTDWDAGLLTVSPSSLSAATTSGDTFLVYYPTDYPYADYFANPTTRVWPLLETFCDRYNEPITAAGFKATAKKWAAECARAQTRALPDNPYSIFYSMGSVNGEVNSMEVAGYDGEPERVSFLATYPHPSFESQDGWMDGLDWGEIAGQAMDYGVNHFVWFMPFLADGCEDPEVDDCFSLNELTTAIGEINKRYINNYGVYANIACVADWNMDGTVTETDGYDFAIDWSYNFVETDLNNDGQFTSTDQDMYGLLMCMGGCAPIDNPGCSESTDCEVADWCSDSWVGVEDLFCFLEDWFNEVPAAYEFGGTPGVAAVLAYLLHWFSYGVGPCEP